MVPINSQKIKILILSHNTEERGTYFRCFGFAKYLVKLGQEVTLVCLQKEKTLKTTIKDNSGVKIILLPRIADSGWGELPAHFGRGIFTFILCLLKKFDVVHTSNVASPTVGLTTFLIYLIKKFKKIKLIVDWDDWWGKGGLLTINQKGWFQESVAEFLETKIPLLADKITLHNDLILQRALESGVKKQNIYKIYNGADVDSYQNFYTNNYNQEKARLELNLPQDKFILFFGSSILTSVPFLLQVLKQIQNENIILVIAGPLHPKYPAMAEELLLQKRVIFTNTIPLTLFRKYLLAADILLLPRSQNSLEDRCTFPARLGDYLLAGRPIIANDVGELSRAFRRDPLGLLARADDQEDFKTKIMQVYNDPNLKK